MSVQRVFDFSGAAMAKAKAFLEGLSFLAGHGLQRVNPVNVLRRSMVDGHRHTKRMRGTKGAPGAFGGPGRRSRLAFGTVSKAVDDAKAGYRGGMANQEWWGAQVGERG